MRVQAMHEIGQCPVWGCTDAEKYHQAFQPGDMAIWMMAGSAWTVMGCRGGGPWATRPNSSLVRPELARP